jgi:hypothetical protein
LTEILRKTFEEQRNNFTTDMEEGRKMLKDLSGKRKKISALKSSIFLFIA